MPASILAQQLVADGGAARADPRGPASGPGLLAGVIGFVVASQERDNPLVALELLAVLGELGLELNDARLAVVDPALDGVDDVGVVLEWSAAVGVAHLVSLVEASPGPRRPGRLDAGRGGWSVLLAAASLPCGSAACGAGAGRVDGAAGASPWLVGAPAAPKPRCGDRGSTR